MRISAAIRPCAEALACTADVGHAGLATLLEDAAAEDALAMADERVGCSRGEEGSVDGDDVGVVDRSQCLVALVNAESFQGL
jgi:SHS2 domain-containing protein